MDCHCKDHLPGEWHSHENCDCGQHEHPTFTFVVTRVMEEDPGSGTAYISKTFMDSLNLEEGDAVEIVGKEGCVLQAKSHPNPWADTRMISVDRHTLEQAGLQLFSQVKLRKRCCAESERVILEVPDTANLGRQEMRAMLKRAEGVVLSGRNDLTLTSPRGMDIHVSARRQGTGFHLQDLQVNADRARERPRRGVCLQERYDLPRCGWIGRIDPEGARGGAAPTSAP